MRALDTNLLVRLLTDDDHAQAQAVRHLLARGEARGERFLIPLAVVLETIWVLGGCYELPRAVIFQTLEQLLHVQVFEFEAPERMRRFIDEGPHSSLDPADLLIGLSARELGCDVTLTLDRRAARSELFELLRTAAK